MSGGHIGYHWHRLEGAALEIEELIAMNNSEALDRFGERIGNGYPKEVIEKFDDAVHTLRQAAEMIERIDYLLSGDDGQESFLRLWCSTPSRRFRCKMCGEKCRSSNQDRGKRDMCRPCEQRYNYGND